MAERAVTWGNGAGGTTGTVSGDNSLVGTYAYDQVGRRGVTALANGNYVVDSDLWGDDAGAVTFGDGTKGVSGPVSSANSLVGGTSNLGGSQGDEVGGGLDPGDGQEYGGVTALPNGNYVIVSAYGLQTGTVTWGNGTTGTLGTVSSANSLRGPPPEVVGSSYSLTTTTSTGYLVSEAVLACGSTVPVGRPSTVRIRPMRKTRSRTPAWVRTSSPSDQEARSSSGATLAFTDPNLLTYALAEGQTITVAPSFLPAPGRGN